MSTVVVVVVCLVAAVGLLALASKKRPSYAATHEEVAQAIECFVEDRGGDHDWDDFLHLSIADPFLEGVRKQCVDVYDEFPAEQKGRYCSDAGFEVLRALMAEVRAKAPRT